MADSTWWPRLLPLICSACQLLPPPQTILSLRKDPTTLHPLPKMRLGSFSIIRKSLKMQNVPKHALTLILQSWRNTTRKQYDVYIKKWLDYCGQSKNPITPDVADVLHFLLKLYRKGCKYSALNNATSAISTFLKLCSNINIRDDELSSRFMRGCNYSEIN